jgi:hypothetical protein
MGDASLSPFPQPRPLELKTTKHTKFLLLWLLFFFFFFFFQDTIFLLILPSMQP